MDSGTSVMTERSSLVGSGKAPSSRGQHGLGNGGQADCKEQRDGSTHFRDSGQTEMKLERWQGSTRSTFEKLGLYPEHRELVTNVLKLSMGGTRSELHFYQKHCQDVVALRRGRQAKRGFKCFIGQTSPGELASVSNHHI